ncbi:MAG: hypothetical protein WBY84_21495, partial [Pseudolabrys sp.]
MSGVGKRERAALEAVARHFSATWEKGEAPPDAYLTIAGKRIAVEVTTTKLRIAERGGLTKPRLRFDRVALGFVRRLQAALSASVPDGRTLILTITAPIRAPSKTAAALEDNIRTYLARQSAQGEAKHTIHGNQIRVRLVKGGSRRTTKVIGFVHNPDSDPDLRHHAFIDRAHRRESMQGRAGKIRGRSMARSRRRRPVIVHRAVSTCLFPVVHPDRLQEGSN